MPEPCPRPTRVRLGQLPLAGLIEPSESEPVPDAIAPALTALLAFAVVFAVVFLLEAAFVLDFALAVFVVVFFSAMMFFL
jgi:hypothetical protein